jgi:hypothetical protein
MGKKAYIGNGKYCYTINCRVHPDQATESERFNNLIKSGIPNIAEAAPDDYFPHTKVRRGLNDPKSLDSISLIQELNKNSDEFYNSLTEEEEKAISSYRYLGYENINAYLFDKTKFLKEHSSRDASYWEERIPLEIATLDMALSKAKLAPSPRTLFRSFKVPGAIKGENNQALIEAFVNKNFPVGSTVEIPNFQSTTIDSDLMVHNGKTSKGRSIVFEIISRRGGVLHVDEDKESWSLQNDEREILLPRNMKFKVHKVIAKATYETTRGAGTTSFDEVQHGYEDWRVTKPKYSFTVVQLIDIS